MKTILKKYPKAGSCEKVIEELKSTKTFKDRVPDGYMDEVQKVKTIFKFQTVFDPRSEEWVPNERPKEGETYS